MGQNDNSQLQELGGTVNDRLGGVESEIYQVKNRSGQDPLNYPVRLNDKLAMLMNLGNRDPRPTQGQRDVLASLKGRVIVQLDALTDLLKKAVPAFNDALAKAKVPAVVVESDE